MAQTSWPNTAGGRAVNDVQWEKMAAGFIDDGIIGLPTDTPVVYGDSTGLQVKVRANRNAVVRGRGWDSGTADFTLAIGANASGSTRIDLVVLRLTRSTWDLSMVVKAGTPGAGAPALTQDPVATGTGTYEVAVAQVTVASGAATISATNVVDKANYIGKVSNRPRGVLARGRRTTGTSASSGTEVPFLRIDDVIVPAGRLIRVHTSSLMHVVSLDVQTFAVIARYTTDGSTPTITSPILSSEQLRMTESDFGETAELSVLYAPAGNETLSVLLSVKRINGTGSGSLQASATQPIDLIIEDVGADPGNIGVSL